MICRKDFESVVGFTGSRVSLEDGEFALSKLFVNSEGVLDDGNI